MVIFAENVGICRPRISSGACAIYYRDTITQRLNLTCIAANPPPSRRATTPATDYAESTKGKNKPEIESQDQSNIHTATIIKDRPQNYHHPEPEQSYKPQRPSVATHRSAAAAACALQPTVVNATREATYPPDYVMRLMPSNTFSSQSNRAPRC